MGANVRRWVECEGKNLWMKADEIVEIFKKVNLHKCIQDKRCGTFNWNKWKDVRPSFMRDKNTIVKKSMKFLIKMKGL